VWAGWDARGGVELSSALVRRDQPFDMRAVVGPGETPGEAVRQSRSERPELRSLPPGVEGLGKLRGGDTEADSGRAQRTRSADGFALRRGRRFSLSY